jgi:protein transport protein SEC23
VPCKGCGAILNPYAQVDYYAKLWVCPMCLSRNHFPAHYQGISEQSVPAELYPQYTTIEYTLGRGAGAPPPHPPVYVFVLDTCLADDELAAMRSSVTQALQLIPEYCHVGLVTFGTHVHVHELGYADCSKCYVFRGSKEYTSAQVVEQLGLRGAGAMARPIVGGGGAAGGPGGGAGGPPGGGPAAGGGSRFVLPLSDPTCDTTINNVLSDLQRDAYPVVSTQRPARCTGTALQVAEALLGASVPPGSAAAHVMLFVGGPCTEGPGMVIGRDLTEEIRSHKDLAKDNAPYSVKARKFYRGLAHEMVGHCHALDVFACALDQTGLFEQRDLVQLTGGVCVQIDTFANPVFKDSLRRVFAKEGENGFLGTSSCGVLEVVPSRDIRVQGLLGPACRVDKKSPHVSETQVGQGGTTAWRMASVDQDATVAVFFEVTAQGQQGGGGGAGQGGGPGGEPAPGQQLYLQFITRYQHWSGQTRCRVTTVTRYWVDGASSGAELAAAFDQECAAAVMARLATHKMETEDDFDATRFLDRALIRLCQRFADYRKDDPASFALGPTMSFYPQFMFNLRRSPFVQVFGFGPDETAAYRLCLYRAPVGDAMVMIQPQLTAYSFQGAEPALLDVASVAPDRILLLDAFFYVVIFHGATIAQWRKAEYHKQAEHAAFGELLSAPQAEAKEIAARRFPAPRLVDCDQNGSQARFLLAKLNPSATYNSSNTGGAVPSSEVIMTDDVSLSVFVSHLQRLTVQS